MVSKIDSMKRIFLLALAAVTAAHSHAQNSSPPATKTAIFAGGCFWCIQPAFDKANGVIKTVVGYSGGTEPNPTYQLSRPKGQTIASRSKSHTTRRKFPTSNCS